MNDRSVLFHSSCNRSMTRALRLVAVSCALLVVPTVARAQDGAREAPAYDAKALDAPKPFAAFSRSAMTLRDSLVALARAQVGTPYVHGGETPARGFDCSGLVRYLVAALHIVVPRTAARQAFAGIAVPKDTAAMLPGDLVTFGRGKKGAVSHIGIYVGNGRIVHASTKAGEVIETDLMKPKVAGIKKWRGARRVLTDDGSTVAVADSIS
jgi:cell wall-associated NlpC family hydrolase